ncbi:uncharacterized protein BJ171DRAFT_505839 [Polychytrium aggregatum]|uniref:uncharacterized protein n=1 Tax=Polychytrium aggregatum TaxID=110093 RepID=UPI0022FE5A13|nr:uncharacterized protein BJ171DRAFT_505839 [Polychytrium aggregatum]KAI9204440.1 hypothetical protein BJ171DRAFT_505839 [Polychytrium aggregatum]
MGKPDTKTADDGNVAIYRWDNVDWLHTTLLTITPLTALYALMTVPLYWQTALWGFVYYLITALGITAGYHRYWAHRSYDASLPFQLFLAFAGTGAFEGSIRWWSRGHRAHHRYTDTPKDPYSFKKGFLWAHIGWMIMKQDSSCVGRVDISDLNRNRLVMLQHKYYLLFAPFCAFVFPSLVAGLLWGDFVGGFFFAGIARQVFVHHATFCVNSLAHWVGEQPFDDKRTPRDHFITALVTCGEGYHNFHHEFPSDYRNAIKFWQYDPTKWLIFLSSLVGLTYNLKMFPENEIQKGRLQMQEKVIAAAKKRLNWGVPVEQLPSLSWDEFQSEVQAGKPLLIIDHVVYNVDKFMDDHPGGKGFLKASIGRDVTQSFNGGIYDHSNASRNLSSSMRYAKLEGPIPESFIAREE